MGMLFSFFGRIGRGGWWLGVLGAIICAVIAFGLAALLAGAPFAMVNPDGTVVPMGVPAGPDAKFVTNPASLAIIGVGYLFGIWISLATSVKRLHDRGRSGWWLLLMFVLSFIIVGGIWQLIECGILEGQQGPNKYGSDPRATQKA